MAIRIVDDQKPLVVHKPVVVHSLVVNKPRSGDRHKDTEARKAYRGPLPAALRSGPNAAALAQV